MFIIFLIFTTVKRTDDNDNAWKKDFKNVIKVPINACK